VAILEITLENKPAHIIDRVPVPYDSAHVPQKKLDAPCRCPLERFRLASECFEILALDPHINREGASGDSLAIAAVTRLRDHRASVNPYRIFPQTHPPASIMFRSCLYACPGC
jgi:hypothetical protein